MKKKADNSFMAQKNDYTIIGIDGGGTRTRGILYKGGRILSQSNSGTTRIGAVGVAESCERLLNVIIELCSKAEIESEELDAVVIGLAGVWLEEEKLRSTQLLKTLARQQKITLNDLLIISDAELALEGAFESDNGVVMIVGTGSIALGRFNKKLSRCGGWGIELDDEGSGAWIGREGLTAIVRSIDGRGNPTKLASKLVELVPTIDLDQPRTIVKSYGEGGFVYQMLTPAVMQCAEEGDQVCKEIIERSAFHLMELLSAIAKDAKVKKMPVALMGGIIDADTILAKMLYERIDKNSGLQRVEPKGNALHGAVSLGFRLIKEMQ